MSPIIRALMVSLLLLAVSGSNLADANSSGKTGQSSAGCTCHATDAMIVPTISGLPPGGYTPGSTYSLTWDGGSAMPSTGEGGFNLDASAGSWTNLGNRVQTLNGELTHSTDLQRSWTADWVAPSGGSGDVTFNLAVLYANGNGVNSNDNWGTRAWTIPEDPAPPTNIPPVASSLALTPNGDVEVNQSFTLTYTYFDEEGEPEGSTEIRWHVDGVLSTSFNDLLTIPSSATSVGEVWTVKVTPHDGIQLGATEDCPDSATIIDIDTDGDGTLDENDAFPNDASEDTDTDGDGTGDNADVFPTDSGETIDSDLDGVGDNADAFPNDPSETMDSDSDGVGNNADAFPFDASETIDSDGDFVGDNADAFPNDANETMDSDGDNVGDNADAFPNDANETIDSDDDDVGDNADAFPNDANETMDSDLDGVGDNADVFPNDANETLDSDLDNVGDNADVFPNDASETMDSDEDNVGDNADVFPNDASETMDTDGDGVGDNADAFPNDASETMDSDNDGVGDNEDALPNDPNETMDTDDDGAGDNSDAFLYDPSETMDSDLDGVGDNADAFPNDASETMDTDGDGVGDNEQLAAELAAKDDDSGSSMMLIIGIIVVVIGGAVVGLLFMRKKGDEIGVDASKDFAQNLMPGQFRPFQPTHVETQVAMPQQAVAQPVAMPAMIAEPVVVQQWTDESGHTWRAMDNGTTLWWNGTDWQQA